MKKSTITPSNLNPTKNHSPEHKNPKHHQIINQSKPNKFSKHQISQHKINPNNNPSNHQKTDPQHQNLNQFKFKKIITSYSLFPLYNTHLSYYSPESSPVSSLQSTQTFHLAEQFWNFHSASCLIA